MSRPRQDPDPARDQAIADAFLAGEPIERICRRHGMSNRTFYKIARRLNLPKRIRQKAATKPKPTAAQFYALPDWKRREILMRY